MSEIPEVGDEAPDAELLTADGTELRLSSLFEQGTVALVFLRHYG